MADDVVVSRLKLNLRQAGFKVEKRKYVKELSESTAYIEIKNNSFGKHQHFVEVTIVFHECVRLSRGMLDGFAIWLRIEGLNSEKCNEYFCALDAKSDIDLDSRIQNIDRIINVELQQFLEAWSTFVGARDLFKTGVLDDKGLSYELMGKWLSKE